MSLHIGAISRTALYCRSSFRICAFQNKKSPGFPYLLLSSESRRRRRPNRSVRTQQKWRSIKTTTTATKQQQNSNEQRTRKVNAQRSDLIIHLLNNCSLISSSWWGLWLSNWTMNIIHNEWMNAFIHLLMNSSFIQARMDPLSLWTSPLKLRQKKNATNSSIPTRTQKSSGHLPNQLSTVAQPSTQSRFVQYEFRGGKGKKEGGLLETQVIFSKRVIYKVFILLSLSLSLICAVSWCYIDIRNECISFFQILSILVSRPLSWAERSAEGRQESRSLVKDKDESKSKVGTARKLLRRSFSFGAKDRDRGQEGPSTNSGTLTSGVAGRRGRSVESLRGMPGRFESYTSPTKSFSQKMVNASSMG